MNDSTIALLGFIFASNGLWGLVTYKVTQRDSKKDIVEQALLAVLHDRLYQACQYFLQQGKITVDEMDNLNYLFKSYKQLGGNGTCEELFKRVKSLPLKHNTEGVYYEN